MNVLFLVYTSSANGKQYWITITAPTDAVNFGYFQNGAFSAIASSDPNYPTITEAQSAQVSYTPDGQYLVMPTGTGVIGYQQVGSATNNLVFPTQAAGILDAKISSDSNFVVGVNNFPPYATCYQRQSPTNFITAGNLTSIHTVPATCLDFSVGGNYLAIGGASLYLYKKNAATFTALTSPVQQTIQCLRFTPDSSILYVGTGSGLIILNRAGDIFTQSSWTIAGNVLGVDTYSKYLAVTTDQGLTVYDTTTQQSVFAQSISGAKSVRFSTDGQHIAVELTSAPYYEVLQWLQS